MALIGRDIPHAQDLLRNDEIVGIPTETVYGLGANAFSEEAVLNVFQAKGRPSYNPLIVHCPSRELAFDLALEIPDTAYHLAQNFWPGPLTLVLKKKSIIPSVVSAGLDTVGLRVPYHPLLLELLSGLDFPLAAPSANRFGEVSPTTAFAVQESLGERVPYILDGGRTTLGLESTIIGFDEGANPILYRLGSLSREEISDCIGRDIKTSVNSENKPLSPGQLSRHYSPKTPLYLCSTEHEVIELLQVLGNGGVLITCNPIDGDIDIPTLTLSKKGDLKEAAFNLYHTLREADRMNVKYIIALQAPSYGLGASINDRLKRASVRA